MILSTDAGVSGTDMTFDGTDSLHPNGLHPDQHALVTNPRQPVPVLRGERRRRDALERRASSTARRGAPSRRTAASRRRALTRCQQMLSRIPSKLEGINKGLPTLQFQSLSVSPHNANVLQGGTQDNGTWETPGNPVKWENTMIGDGGQSGFDAAIPSSASTRSSTRRRRELLERRHRRLDLDRRPDLRHRARLFYVADHQRPEGVSGTMFAGTGRTSADEDARHRAPMTLARGPAALQRVDRRPSRSSCGDWVEIGPTRARPTRRRGDRAGGARRRRRADGGRHVDGMGGDHHGPRLHLEERRRRAGGERSTWTRLDDAPRPTRTGSSAASTSTRRTPNHAWVSYTGFDATTPATPGHVFEVTYNPAPERRPGSTARTTSVTCRSTTSCVDDVTGDLYASSDFGVHRARQAARPTWTSAAPGMPNVEVAGLDDRAGRADPLRRDPRPQRLEAEPAARPTRPDD